MGLFSNLFKKKENMDSLVEEGMGYQKPASMQPAKPSLSEQYAEAKKLQKEQQQREFIAKQQQAAQNRNPAKGFVQPHNGSNTSFNNNYYNQQNRNPLGNNQPITRAPSQPPPNIISSPWEKSLPPRAELVGNYPFGQQNPEMQFAQSNPDHPLFRPWAARKR